MIEIIYLVLEHMCICTNFQDLTQLHLKGERLYNKEGVYETDVDHLAEIYKNLYHKVN